MLTASTRLSTSSSPVPPTGDLATSVGAPTELSPRRRPSSTRTTPAGYADPYEAYGAYSYDAANAIIQALKVSLAKADSEAARQGTVTAMSDVAFDGVTGKVAFDEYGDTTSRVLTVYAVDEWQVRGRGDRGVQVNPGVTSHP